jgi:hypothetical protein
MFPKRRLSAWVGTGKGELVGVKEGKKLRKIISTDYSKSTNKTDEINYKPISKEDIKESVTARVQEYLNDHKDGIYMGKISDGFHTFDELYHHRAVLFAVVCSFFEGIAWKSRFHHDGTMYNGMFIVGIETPEGQATYHYDIDPYWDVFDINELPNAPERDGHTPQMAIDRIEKLIFRT